jgi:hypothetical protein
VNYAIRQGFQLLYVSHNLVGRRGYNIFGSFLGGAAVGPSRGGIFLNTMVGGGRGVAGPKELMALGGAVTDRRAKLCLPPVPRQTARRLSKKTDGRFKKYYISG